MAYSLSFPVYGHAPFAQALILIIRLNAQTGIKSSRARYSRGRWSPDGLNTSCQGKASASAVILLQQIRSRKPAAQLLRGMSEEFTGKQGKASFGLVQGVNTEMSVAYRVRQYANISETNAAIKCQ